MAMKVTSGVWLASSRSSRIVFSLTVDVLVIVLDCGCKLYSKKLLGGFRYQVEKPILQASLRGNQKYMRRTEDVHGQPQCRRKEMIVGFPSAFETGSLDDRGAAEPTFGTGDICKAGGLIHELSS